MCPPPNVRVVAEQALICSLPCDGNNGWVGGEKSGLTNRLTSLEASLCASLVRVLYGKLSGWWDGPASGSLVDGGQGSVVPLKLSDVVGLLIMLVHPPLPPNGTQTNRPARRLCMGVCVLDRTRAYVHSCLCVLMCVRHV